jgi:hypothetical protein
MTNNQSKSVKSNKGGYRVGAGRKKGVPNKITGELKDMILQALADAGGVDYLKGQAENNPGPFLSLVGKVLPYQVTGADGGPVKVEATWLDGRSL